MHPLIDTWKINQHMNELLLNGIQENDLADVAPSKGRSVGEQFAHIHNVRLMWLKAALPLLLEGQNKIENGSITNQQLNSALKQSAPAIVTLLESGIETGRIKGFKPHPEAFLGYLISHESHHRGQIILTLKLNGHLPNKKILYGLWEWGIQH
jgi:uncharacterized damage-inducible protein DinB